MGTETATSRTKSAFDKLLINHNHYMILVDTRLRTTTLFVNIKTQDFVSGKLVANIEYQVVNLETLFNISDPLATLKDKISKLIINFVAQHNWESINEKEIKEKLRQGNELLGTGLVIRDALNIEIQWADSITKKLQQSVDDKIEDKTKRKFNDLKLEKLRSFGIYNPTLIVSVLSQSDSDFETIMGYVRSISQTHKDETERDINVLNWLKEKDLLTEADVQKIIGSIKTNLEGKSKSDSTGEAVNNFNIDSNTISNSAIGANPVTTNKSTTENESTKITINGTNNSSNMVGESILREFQFSAAYPLAFSKRYESVILCQIYLPKSRSRALENIKFEFQEQLTDEKIKSSFIKWGQKITVKLEGGDFSFSEPITKTINDTLIKFAFIVVPKDGCEPGYHKIKTSIIDTKSGEEFDYLTLNHIRVVDFAFDHVSRPLLSKVSSAVLGVGSFAMFILTFLEQIDKTIGLTSGTAAGVLALGIYVNFYSLYKRIYPSTL